MRRIDIAMLSTMHRPFGIISNRVEIPSTPEASWPIVAVEVVMVFDPNNPNVRLAGFVTLIGNRADGWLAAYWANDFMDALTQYNLLLDGAHKGYYPKEIERIGPIDDLEKVASDPGTDFPED